jgi:cellulose synthase (UDP-forming)
LSFSERLERSSKAIYCAWSRTGVLVRTGLIVFAIAFLFISAASPLTPHEQLVTLTAMWGLTLVIRKLHGAAPGLIMMVFSIIASSRYIWWRLTQTLDLDSRIEMFLGGALIAAECYTWIVLVLGYIQNARPLHRDPVALPRDRSRWPTVDVWIPTYNEPLKVVKPTVLAALNLDWPADKLKIYILDDGRRAEYRRFASEAGVGYIARPNNAHAKAGNLNNALKVTTGRFIAIFDCDHIPVRSFLTTTMGSFDADPRCAMVQTPHHFFSPDPFERNLGTFRRVPNEGRLFYGLIQDGNDLWNAAFFCGSCAVLRRGPLEEIGGIAEETVTEDAHTALKMHRRGYTTAYLRQLLAGGLATESLSNHIGQRIRWARGMAQIFRLDNPFSGKGLTLVQRLCYANSMLHFFSGIPRLIFLISPLMYLYFELHIINAAAMTLATYAVPHIVQSTLANSHLQGRHRHSFWNQTYEAVLSWYIALPTTVALINPRLGKFNVTAKGGLVEHDFFDWRIAAPYLVLGLLNLIGAVLAIPRFLMWNSFEADTVLVNLIWTLFNLIPLGAVLGVAAETRQVRAAHRVATEMPATLYTAHGAKLAADMKDFSAQGLGLTTHTLHDLKAGAHVTVTLTDGNVEHRFPATVASVRKTHIGLALNAVPIEKERDYVRCTFASPSAWADCGKTVNVDRPLASFAEVLSFGATGYLRLFESIVIGSREFLGR